MPTLAAVPSQRTTQRPTPAPTKRISKRPHNVNEIPATVRPQAHPDQIWRIRDPPSNVEYTIYTLHVNIQTLVPTNFSSQNRILRIPNNISTL